jgi:4-coumarate--CoA ligase
MPPSTITERVLCNASAHPERRAIVVGETGSFLTYGQLADRIGRARATLIDAGIQPGDVVALMAPTTPDYVTAFHGIASAGSVVTPLNPSYTPHELRHQLQDSGAVAIVCSTDQEKTAYEAADGMAAEKIVLLEQLATWAGSVPPAANDHAALAALPYSSGTTGLPKGVMLAHSNLVAQLESLAAADALDAGHVSLAVVPFFHILGMQLIMNNTLAQGGTIVTMRRFNAEATLRAIEEHGVNRLYAVPPVLAALAACPDLADHDLTSLSEILTGAAPMGPEQIAIAAERLGCSIRQGFGMTELAGASHMTEAGERPDNCGRPLPGIECRTVDEAGRPAPAGTPGELWIRSPQVMRGYWQDPEATAATIVDGWLRTGDVACIDSAGRLTIVDRLKELIKCNGFQVAPAELEAALTMHEAVADAAVIGISDDVCGEVPKAFVVVKSGRTVGAEQLQDFVNCRLSRYKHIRHLEFIAAVPRTPSGKVMRRELRQR